MLPSQKMLAKNFGKQWTGMYLMECLWVEQS